MKFGRGWDAERVGVDNEEGEGEAEAEESLLDLISGFGVGVGRGQGEGTGMKGVKEGKERSGEGKGGEK